ncbi:MAG: HYC_CC_PP family protein [Flavobacteriaceae bacterium]
MKTILSNLFSVTMGLLVLASTVSWTVEKHLCMGHVVSVAFFSEADGCGMAMGAENHCCEDERFTLTGQDDLKSSVFEYAFDQAPVVFIHSVGYDFKPFSPQPLEVIALPTYHPPPIFEDIQLLQQVFLI